MERFNLKEPTNMGVNSVREREREIVQSELNLGSIAVCIVQLYAGYCFHRFFSEELVNSPLSILRTLYQSL
jgi:uncharacterized membrane protein